MKQVTYGQAYLEDRGYEIVNFLNKMNFQPGKFWIIPTSEGEMPHTFKIIFVIEEEEL